MARIQTSAKHRNDNLITNHSTYSNQQNSNNTHSSNSDLSTYCITARINSFLHFLRFNAGVFNCIFILILFLCITFPSVQISQILYRLNFSESIPRDPVSELKQLKHDISTMHIMLSDLTLEAHHNMTVIQSIYEHHGQTLESLHQEMKEMQILSAQSHPTITEFAALEARLSTKDMEWMKAMEAQRVTMQQQTEQIQAIHQQIDNLTANVNQQAITVEQKCRQEMTAMLESYKLNAPKIDPSTTIEFNTLRSEMEDKLHGMKTQFDAQFDQRLQPVEGLENELKTLEAAWTRNVTLIEDKCRQEMVVLIKDFKSNILSTEVHGDSLPPGTTLRTITDSVTKSVRASLMEEWTHRLGTLAYRVDNLVNDINAIRNIDDEQTRNWHTVRDEQSQFREDLVTIKKQIEEIWGVFATNQGLTEAMNMMMDMHGLMMGEWKAFQSESLSTFEAIDNKLDALEKRIRIDIDFDVRSDFDNGTNTGTNGAISSNQHRALLECTDGIKKEMAELRMSLKEQMEILESSSTAGSSTTFPPMVDMGSKSSNCFDERADYAMKVLYHTEIMTQSVGEGLRMKAWYYLTQLYDQNAVTPTMKWGECTKLKMVDDTFVILKFKEAIAVNGITVEHMRPDLIGGHSDDAPKQMRLELSSDGHFYYDVTHNAVDHQIMYDPKVNGGKKYFELVMDTNEMYRFAKVTIASNYGAEFICLYRVQIHGVKDVFV